MYGEEQFTELPINMLILIIYIILTISPQNDDIFTTAFARPTKPNQGITMIEILRLLFIVSIIFKDFVS